MYCTRHRIISLSLRPSHRGLVSISTRHRKRAHVHGALEEHWQQQVEGSKTQDLEQKDFLSPDQLVVGAKQQVPSTDSEREIGLEGGEGRLRALRDAEQTALESRGYGGGVEESYENVSTASDDEKLDDRSEQVDIGRSA